MACQASDVEGVSINGYETWINEKRFTVYKVLVKTPAKTWLVFRRYKDFFALHTELKKAGFLVPKLPGKRLMGNNFSKDFLIHRMQGLDAFLQHMMTDVKMIAFELTKEFLALNNTREAVAVIDGNFDEAIYQSHADSANDENRLDLGKAEVSLHDFKLDKIIGKGNFGTVILGQRKSNNKYYAIKVLEKAAVLKMNKSQHIMAERNVLLKNARHPFLVGLHYSFQTAKHLFYVLDYVNGGELFYHLQIEQTFSEPRALFYAAEITSALGYLHSLNVIYRDLKPENILIDGEGHVKVTDFGLCKENVMDGDMTGTFCGTPEYLAPEVLQKKPYNKSIDWWCLGCVLHEMLFGLPPWYSRNMLEMYNGVINLPLRLKSTGSFNAKSILRELLEKEPTDRLGSTDDMISVMAHPFFESINWADLYEGKIPPPWKPCVDGQGDTANISDEFTSEPLCYSQYEDTEDGDEEVRRFKGFTFYESDTSEASSPPNGQSSERSTAMEE